jgi:hypothetical protein
MKDETLESSLLEQDVVSLIVQRRKEAGFIQRALRERWDGLICDHRAVKPFITLQLERRRECMTTEGTHKI